jgi:FkbM family methyltransferase
MNGVRKILLSALGEKRYLALLAQSFQKLYKLGIPGTDYQDIYFLKRFVREGDYCVDIGAHLGYYTLELSRLVKSTGKVLAIEPMSKFYHTILGILQENRITNVDLRQLAMGGEGEWVEMGIPQVNNMKKFAYARVMNSSSYLDYVESEKVKNEQGDALLSGMARLDFIKCDVEGLEVSVFSSMIETLRRHRPILLCELGDRRDRIQLFEKLRPMDYEVYYLEKNSLHPMDVYSEIKPVSHNHYFIPPGSLDRFERVLSPARLSAQ